MPQCTQRERRMKTLLSQICSHFTKTTEAERLEAGRGAEAQSVTIIIRLIVGSIPTRGNEIFIYVYIFISSLRCRGKARR